nr:hypothetical protein [Tanacetum cinerariifolium]
MVREVIVKVGVGILALMVESCGGSVGGGDGDGSELMLVFGETSVEDEFDEYVCELLLANDVNEECSWTGKGVFGIDGCDDCGLGIKDCEGCSLFGLWDSQLRQMRLLLVKNCQEGVDVQRLGNQ